MAQQGPEEGDDDRIEDWRGKEEGHARTKWNTSLKQSCCDGNSGTGTKRG